MKPLSALFAASLAINVALLALVALRWKPPGVTPPMIARATPAETAEAVAAEARKTTALLAALAQGDLAALTAAGVAPEVIRHLAAARAFARFAALSRKLESPPPGTEYWRGPRGSAGAPPTRDQRHEHAVAERELDVAMADAFGGDWKEGWRPGRYSFLSAEKQAQLERIERDYEEIQWKLSFEANDVELPADREKFALLKAEKERDLAAVLTPAEREQIELHSSRSAHAIIGRYGDILASEEEYKRLYTLQKAFEDRHGFDPDLGRPRTSEEHSARYKAELKLNDDLRAALGESRWATIPRANDEELRVLTSLTTRLGLPPTTSDRVYALRDTYAAQSLAIQQDSSLSTAARRTQLTALATRATAELRDKLGVDGAEAYGSQAAWLNHLKEGAAFTTDPRLLPPGSARPASAVSPLPPPKG